MSEYSRGGYTGSRGDLPMVTARRMEGRMEYWEPAMGRWIPVLTAADLRERQARIQECLVAPEQELADDYERNDHH